MPTPLYDLVKGPQGDPAPQPYNVKWEDEAREKALADNPVAETAIDRTATVVVATDVFTLTAHGMTNGTPVKITSITTATGLTVGNVYYVIAAAANTFQLSATSGGAAVNLGGADGSITFVAGVYAIVGTPIVPAHYFDRRDGAVTAPAAIVLP